MRLHRFAALPLLLALPLLMAERCGPATSLEPAYVRGAVVTDDSLPGAYVAVSAEGSGKKKGVYPAAAIVREETEDGPSYVLTMGGDPSFKDVKLRMFLFDIGAQRYADLVAEDHSKTGEFAKSLALPQHVLFKVRRPPGGGITLEYLEAKWLDAEAAKDPKGLPMRALPRRYRQLPKREPTSDREPILVADTAAVQKLLARAAPVAAAWEVGLELVKKGAPVLRFSVTTEEREAGAETSVTSESFAVMGSLIEYYRIPAQGESQPPAAPASAASATTKTRGVVKDPAAIDALARAFQKAPRSTPKKPVPKSGARIERTCFDAGTPRCIDRALDDDSGADLAALVALREALRASVVIPAP